MAAMPSRNIAGSQIARFIIALPPYKMCTFRVGGAKLVNDLKLYACVMKARYKAW
jgi:hypothetical protein